MPDNNYNLTDFLNKQLSPMMASVNWDPRDDTFEERKDWFGKFIKLNVKIKYGLSSKRMAEVILGIARKYGIVSYQEVGEISRIVREVFTDKIKEEAILKRGREKLKIEERRLEEFLKDVKKIVSLVKQIGEEEFQADFESINIKEALEKYEQVGKQQITEKPIKIENYSRPVWPSIKNWLEDYLEKMNAGEHTSMERNRYLFNTENAKKLSAEERQRVAQLLESFDEGRRLDVDKTEGLINFRNRNLIEDGIAEERSQVETQKLGEKKIKKGYEAMAVFKPRKKQEEVPIEPREGDHQAQKKGQLRGPLLAGSLKANEIDLRKKDNKQNNSSDERDTVGVYDKKGEGGRNVVDLSGF